MRSPIAVALGDIHFTVATLELASSAARQARALACKLGVPLLFNGDTLDGKAVIRGECQNRLIEIITDPKDMPPRTIFNVGNHDLLSQKSKEHTLNFLRPYAEVIDTPTWDADLESYIVPYFDKGEELQSFLDTVKSGSRMFLHQGVMGAEMGHYIKDTSSLGADAFANFRVILSHYHKRQDIKTGRPRKGAVGLASFLGSPYSISFSEAHDGPKGINIVYDDGTLELVPTNLRKHVIAEETYADFIDGVGQAFIQDVRPGDLVWLKLRGSASDLAKIKKADIAAFLGTKDFKFDKIVDDSEKTTESVERLTDAEIIDQLIDQTPESVAVKAELKSLWREVMS